MELSCAFIVDLKTGSLNHMRSQLGQINKPDTHQMVKFSQKQVQVCDKIYSPDSFSAFGDPVQAAPLLALKMVF